MKLVSIITVNYNSSNVTEELLYSIFKNNTYTNIEILVIDNNSAIDPTIKWKKEFPSVRFIRTDKNLGFAGGNNIGIAKAKGDYLFLVNNDTEFTEYLVERLVSILNDNANVGVVSPKILYYHEPTMLQYVGYTDINSFTARNHCIGQFEQDSGQYDHYTGKTGYAHGAAMMVRKTAVEKAGLMAENYFLYYEELDWCERIKKNGFEIWVDPKAVIYHKESVSVGRQSAIKEYYMNRNRILFQRKHAPFLVYLVFINYFLFFVAPRNIFKYLRIRKFYFILVFFKAVWWNFSNKSDSQYLYFPLTR